MNLGIKQAIKDGNVCCIYLIISPTGKYYVGQTINLKHRMKCYRHPTEVRYQTRVHNSLNKHGFENHKFVILRECPKSELNFWECFYISLFDSRGQGHGLNVREGGSHGPLSEETKAKLSKALTGRIVSDETRQKMRETNLRLGRRPGKLIWTDEVREHYKEYWKTHDHPSKGKPISEEHREKIRRANTGRKFTEEHKRKISEANRNRKITEESRRKISDSKKGKCHRKHTEETKKKISESHKGKKFTDEHRKNISISRKGRKLTEDQKKKISISLFRRYGNEEQANKLLCS